MLEELITHPSITLEKTNEIALRIRKTKGDTEGAKERNFHFQKVLNVDQSRWQGAIKKLKSLNLRKFFSYFTLRVK